MANIFSINDQIINILGVKGQIVSVSITEFSCYSVNTLIVST